MNNTLNDGIEFVNQIHSFLMMGQSNMAGRGEFGEVEEIDNNLCFMLRMGRWQKMSEPINPDRAVLDPSFHSGISLAASFADEYAKKYQVKTGLIPCADGGTGISQWQPGEILFDHAAMQAELAMRTSELKGILWHQGERDCQSEEDFDAYYDRFCRMANEFRNKLGMPNLPIVLGEISENISDNWNIPKERSREFNRLLKKIAETVPACKVAAAAELPVKADGIHFTSRSSRILGRRYFEAYSQWEKLK